MYHLNKIRAQFPMLDGKKMQGKNLVYLDNASTTFKPYTVIKAMDDYYLNLNANSHRGDYDLCYNVDVKLEDARKTVAKFVNCESNEVIFTSGTTDSLNILAYGYALKYLNDGDEILISESEHASNSIPWFKIKKIKNITINFVPLDQNGRITPENLSKVISHRTKIVSLAHVGNVLGHDINIKDIANIVHKNNAIFIVDGAQSVPHQKTDFKDWGIDFLAFSAHKMCGPTGVGCLIGKYDLLKDMDSPFEGGGTNITFNKQCEVYDSLPPAKFEAGTLNLSGIIGFKAAIDFINEIGIDNIHQHDIELTRYAIEEMKKLDNVIVYNQNSFNGIVSFNVKGVFAQDEATLLNSKGIAVRSGQHCAKMLNEFLDTPATCRASFYLYTSKEDVDALINALKEGGDILDAYFS